ncbi:hypothetical protein EGR_03063 [Echinococcus granulosus]|uniref:Uncharacterized protein n=1 Tax=Echinococcus granulosus TaxID=6210 RepID=W6UUJ3_ECHGR|nr:hypothetical protein EGR_03063 [Echinococcus granulosus]EUB62042.1 hypothetical protein EGR_03063 [Echinococcus granulosus]
MIDDNPVEAVFEMLVCLAEVSPNFKGYLDGIFKSYVKKTRKEGVENSYLLKMYNTVVSRVDVFPFRLQLEWMSNFTLVQIEAHSVEIVKILGRKNKNCLAFSQTAATKRILEGFPPYLIRADSNRIPKCWIVRPFIDGRMEEWMQDGRRDECGMDSIVGDRIRSKSAINSCSLKSLLKVDLS